MKNSELNYTTVATKLSKTDKAKFFAIANDLGLTFYQLIQAVFLCILRYFDKDSHISYEHNAMLNAFGNIFLSIDKDSHCPVSLRGKSGDNVRSAILFVERPKMDGLQLLMLTRHGAELTENYNQDTMLENLLCCIDKDVLAALKREKSQRNYFSLSQTLHDIVIERTKAAREGMQAEIEEMFGDVRITTGEKICTDIHYKRGHNRSIDGYTAITPSRRTYKAEL